MLFIASSISFVLCNNLRFLNVSIESGWINLQKQKVKIMLIEMKNKWNKSQTSLKVPLLVAIL